MSLRIQEESVLLHTMGKTSLLVSSVLVMCTACVKHAQIQIWPFWILCLRMIIIWELVRFSISEHEYLLIRIWGGIKIRFIAGTRDIFLPSVHIDSGTNLVSYQKGMMFFSWNEAVVMWSRLLTAIWCWC